MGVRQSKRSVDITTKDGEPNAANIKAAALDGKLEKIEEGGDLKAKVANGHANGDADAKVRRAALNL
ncbi:hypothetical protein ONE63_004962 [Megalurothrips usitatus]|uniref:Uncharacterized protein n=1 Tax=Megalurothrips usitatus TaxID=439358 RepID=A0AAV7X270_9NEOP|nr:hypothetical protein ONE63_004962 [Megalurothrips usitatus]